MKKANKSLSQVKEKKVKIIKEDSKHETVNKELINDSELENNLMISYKNTLALGEVSGRIPAWAHTVSFYGCELFKRNLNKTELDILSDSISGFSSFFTAINERLTNISNEIKGNKQK